MSAHTPGPCEFSEENFQKALRYINRLEEEQFKMRSRFQEQMSYQQRRHDAVYNAYSRLHSIIHFKDKITLSTEDTMEGLARLSLMREAAPEMFELLKSLIENPTVELYGNDSCEKIVELIQKIEGKDE